MPSIKDLAFAFVFGALTTITSGLALPKEPELQIDRSVEQGQQSCKVKNNGLYVSTEILIGSAFDVDKCRRADDSLKKRCLIASWRCEDFGEDRTAVYYDVAINRASCVNPTLKSVYDEINGFNCPDT